MRPAGPTSYSHPRRTASIPAWNRCRRRGPPAAQRLAGVRCATTDRATGDLLVLRAAGKQLEQLPGARSCRRRRAASGGRCRAPTAGRTSSRQAATTPGSRISSALTVAASPHVLGRTTACVAEHGHPRGDLAEQPDLLPGPCAPLDRPGPLERPPPDRSPATNVRRAMPRSRSRPSAPPCPCTTGRAAGRASRRSSSARGTRTRRSARVSRITSIVNGSEAALRAT